MQLNKLFPQKIPQKDAKIIAKICQKNHIKTNIWKNCLLSGRKRIFGEKKKEIWKEPNSLYFIVCIRRLKKKLFVSEYCHFCREQLAHFKKWKKKRAKRTYVNLNPFRITLTYITRKCIKSNFFFCQCIDLYRDLSDLLFEVRGVPVDWFPLSEEEATNDDWSMAKFHTGVDAIKSENVTRNVVGWLRPNNQR